MSRIVPVEEFDLIEQVISDYPEGIGLIEESKFFNFIGTCNSPKQLAGCFIAAYGIADVTFLMENDIVKKHCCPRYQRVCLDNY